MTEGVLTISDIIKIIYSSSEPARWFYIEIFTPLLSAFVFSMQIDWFVVLNHKTFINNAKFREKISLYQGWKFGSIVSIILFFSSSSSILDSDGRRLLWRAGVGNFFYHRANFNFHITTRASTESEWFIKNSLFQKYAKIKIIIKF